MWVTVDSFYSDLRKQRQTSRFRRSIQSLSLELNLEREEENDIGG